jgi:hypothetical protein
LELELTSVLLLNYTLCKKKKKQFGAKNYFYHCYPDIDCNGNTDAVSSTADATDGRKYTSGFVHLKGTSI